MTFGVGVAGGTVGRGVSRFAGLTSVGVGAGGGDVPKPHAEASVTRMRMGNRRCIESRSPWQRIYGTAPRLTPKSAGTFFPVDEGLFARYAPAPALLVHSHETGA
jgi:hypothetical protein